MVIEWVPTSQVIRWFEHRVDPVGWRRLCFVSSCLAGAEQGKRRESESSARHTPGHHNNSPRDLNRPSNKCPTTTIDTGYSIVSVQCAGDEPPKGPILMAERSCARDVPPSGPRQRDRARFCGGRNTKSLRPSDRQSPLSEAKAISSLIATLGGSLLHHTAGSGRAVRDDSRPGWRGATGAPPWRAVDDASPGRMLSWAQRKSRAPQTPLMIQ